MCSLSRGAAGSLSVSMARHATLKGRSSGAHPTRFRQVNGFRSTSDQAPSRSFAAVTPRRASHPESLAKAAFAGRGDADRARLGTAADPVQRKAARRERRTKGAADMEAPLAPIETGPAIDVAAPAGIEIHPEVAAKTHAGLGHRAALAGQLDIAVFGQRVGQTDAELAGEMVVACA